MSFSMNQLYAAVGITRQAVHRQLGRDLHSQQGMDELVSRGDALRQQHPGCGVEKMYHVLKPPNMGRDRFIAAFMSLGYRLKRKKNYHRTTVASDIYRPNLIKGMVVDAPCTVWQSDITYIPVGEKHCYAVFIIDVYTREIVGFSVSDNMRAGSNITALKMVIRKWGAPRIHHSDRGGQYISRLCEDTAGRRHQHQHVQQRTGQCLCRTYQQDHQGGIPWAEMGKVPGPAQNNDNKGGMAL